jgi:hypothetical protein
MSTPGLAPRERLQGNDVDLFKPLQLDATDNDVSLRSAGD